MDQPSAVRSYTMRSWRRSGRPYQNSMRWGTILKPPQNSGRGTGFPSVLAFDFPVIQFEVFAGFEHAALSRCPCAELTAARALVEVGVRLLVRHPFRSSVDPDLLVQRHPVETQRRMRIGGQLLSLAALIVGEETEAPFVDRSHQDDPRRRSARRIGRRQRGRDRIYLMRARALRCIEKLRNGIAARHTGILAFPRTANRERDATARYLSPRIPDLVPHRDSEDLHAQRREVGRAQMARERPRRAGAGNDHRAEGVEGVQRAV